MARKLFLIGTKRDKRSKSEQNSRVLRDWEEIVEERMGAVNKRRAVFTRLHLLMSGACRIHKRLKFSIPRWRSRQGSHTPMRRWRNTLYAHLPLFARNPQVLAEQVRHLRRSHHYACRYHLRLSAPLIPSRVYNVHSTQEHCGRKS